VIALAQYLDRSGFHFVSRSKGLSVPLFRLLLYCPRRRALGLGIRAAEKWSGGGQIGRDHALSIEDDAGSRAFFVRPNEFTLREMAFKAFFAGKQDRLPEGSSGRVTSFPQGRRT